jgi:heterodisulfide reductase subunit C
MSQTVGTRQEPAEAQQIDSDFKYEISKTPGGEKLLNCFQCGTCTSDCPIARFSDTYRPRQIVRMAQLGLKKKVLSSNTLWLCASCFTCTDRCPQDVEVANVIRVLRNLAAHKGYMPQVFRELGSNILETGYAYRIPESRIRKRETLGLPPLPTSDKASLTKTVRNAPFLKLMRKELDESG